jgi:excisionase family DNA binding protein
MLTVAQTADRCGCSRDAVYDYVHRGDLPATQYPGTGRRPGPIRISEADVDAFIKEHRMVPS